MAVDIYDSAWCLLIFMWSASVFKISPEGSLSPVRAKGSLRRYVRTFYCF